MGNVSFSTCLKTADEPEFVPWPRLPGFQFWDDLETEGLYELLQKNGGLLQVVDAFPLQTAHKVLATLTSVHEADWKISNSRDARRAEHFFWKYSGTKVDFMRAPLAHAAPHMHLTLRAARYGAGGKIGLHNDADSWVLSPEDVEKQSPFPAGVRMFRKIAFIYYATKDWHEEYGGCLVDNLKDGPQTIVPLFNSMIAFIVPREHLVTEMARDVPNRYTCYGWFSDNESYPPGVPAPLGSGNNGCELDSDDETDEGYMSSDGNLSVDSV